jgi:ABC-2 type transport system ATP-binding protein
MDEKDQGKKNNSTINAEGVIVKFGQVIALNNFSTKVPNGIVGLLGPNGAGKSTFIKTVLGLVKPQAGKIRIAGLDPHVEITKVRDTIGYMPEHDCLINSMNSVELVSYMGQISGMTKVDAIQRTHEVLDFIGIGEERYRAISSYSTGMKQRVKLAQAIVHDPDILFLDEPTNGMDPQGREDMLALIEKIGASGKTLLVSTHLLHEVEQISSYVIIINEGMLVTEGPIEELMGKGDGRFAIKIRGNAENIQRFKDGLAQNHKVLSTIDESGQASITVNALLDSKPVFKLATDTSVQVRSIRPDVLTLEDVFVESFRVKDNDSEGSSNSSSLQGSDLVDNDNDGGTLNGD